MDDPLLYDPERDELARKCWISIREHPELWTASERSTAQGQAWFQVRGQWAVIFWLDASGLASVYEFGGVLATPAEQVRDAERIWKAIRGILESASRSETGD